MKTLSNSDKTKHVVLWTTVASCGCLVPSIMSFGLHGANLFAYLFYPYSCLLGGLLQRLDSAYPFSIVVISMLAQMPLYGFIIGRRWIRHGTTVACAVLLSLHAAATLICLVLTPLAYGLREL